MGLLLTIYNRGKEDIYVPQTPNFIRRVEDNFPIPIAELTDAQLRKIANEWRDDLLTKAAVRRRIKV